MRIAPNAKCQRVIVVSLWLVFKITFRVRLCRGEMYIGHGRLCVSVCLFLAASPHYCTDPEVTWGMVRGSLYLCTIGRICNRCMSFVDMTTYRRTRNVSECLYSLYLWFATGFIIPGDKDYQKADGKWFHTPTVV